MKVSSKNSIFSLLCSFYWKELYGMIRTFQRGKILSIILILIESIEILAFSLSKELKSLANKDTHFSFLLNKRYEDFDKNEWVLNVTLYSCLIINIGLIAYLVTQIVIYIYQQKQIKGYVEDDDSVYMEEKQNGNLHVIKNSFSFILAIYSSILFVPCFFCSLQELHTSRGLINLILAIILSKKKYQFDFIIIFEKSSFISFHFTDIIILIDIIISDCEYDYSISSKDHLNRAFSFSQSLFISIGFPLIFVVINLINQNECLLAALLFSLNLLLSALVSPYYTKNIQNTKIATCIYFIFASIITSAAIDWGMKPHLLAFLIIIAIPFSIKFAMKFQDLREEMIKQAFLKISKGEQHSTLIEMDMVIRQNLFGPIESQKYDDERCVLLLSGSILSSLNDTLYTDDINWRLELNNRIRNVLKEKFKNEIRSRKKKKDNRQDMSELFIYFIFLIELVECQRLYFLKFSQLKFELINSKKMSIKYKQQFWSIHLAFLKKRSILRRIQGRNSSFDDTFIEVLQFEESLTKSYIGFDEAVRIKVQILGCMKSKTIHAETLINQIEELQKQAKQVRQDLNQLTEINPDNPDLMNLQALFLENLAFNEKDISLVSKRRLRNKLKRNKNRNQMLNIREDNFNRSKKMNKSDSKPGKDPSEKNDKSKSKNSKNQKQDVQQQEYDTESASDEDNSSLSTYALSDEKFNEQTCVIFARCQDIHTFLISKTSLNFVNVFGAEGIRFKNKSIETLMPGFLRVYHSKYLEQYFDERIQSNEHLSCKMTNQIIFSSLNGQYILPVKIDIRLNQMNLLNEFGISAKIKKVNSQKEYIIYDVNNLLVLAITQKLHAKLQVSSSHENLNKLKLAKIFPFIRKKVNSSTEETPTDKNVLLNQDCLSPKSIIPDSLFSATKHSRPFIIIRKFENPNNKLSEKDKFMTSTSNNTQIPSMTKLKMKQQKPNIIPTFNADSYSFIYVEVKIKSIKYSLVQSLNYLEISKLRILSPFDSPALILSHIKHPKLLPFYYKLFQQAEMTQIIQELEARILLLSQSHNSLVFKNNNYLEEDKDKNQPQNKRIEEAEDEDFSARASDGHNQQNLQYPKYQDPMQNQTPFSSQELGELHHSQEQIFNRDTSNKEYYEVQSFNQPQNEHQLNLINTSANFNQMNNSLQQVNPTSSFVFQNKYPNGVSQDDLLLFNSANMNNTSQIKTNIGNQSSSQLFEARPSISFAKFQDRIQEVPQSTFLPSGNSISINYVDNLMKYPPNKPLMSPVSNAGDKLKHSSPNLLEPVFSPSISQNSGARGLMQIYSPISQSATSMLSPQSFHHIQNNQNVNSHLQHLPSGSNSNTLELLRNREKFAENSLEQQQNKNSSNINKSSEFLSGDSNINQVRKSVKLKEEKLRKVEEIQQEISSTNSKESSSASAKRQLCLIMADKSKLRIIKTIEFLGISCFFAMVSVTLVQYLQMRDSINSLNEDYQIFEWPTKYQSTLSCIFKEQNALYMTTDSFVPFNNPSDKKKFRGAMNGDMMNYKDILRGMISQMEGLSSQRRIFQLMRNHYFMFQIGQQYNLTKIAGTNSIPSELVAVQWNSTIQIAIILAFQHVYRYSAGVGKGRPEYYMIQNQLLQISNLKTVQEKMLGLQIEEEDTIQSNLITLMVVIIVVTALCIGIIIPLFAYIQQQRDIIIQLFATFPTQKIELLLKNIYKSYVQQGQFGVLNRNANQIKQMVLQQSMSEKENKDTRKQNISYISQLPRLNIRLIFLIILIYLLIIFYPIINKIISQNYLTQSSLDLQTMSNKDFNIVFLIFLFQKVEVYQLRSFMLENIAINNNIITMKLYPKLKPQSVRIYYNYTQNLLLQAETFLAKIDWLINEQYVHTRYNQGLYDDFFFTVLKGNICTTFEKFPQYNTNTTRMNLDSCATLNQGVLTHGIQVSYKKYLQMFPDLYLIYTESNTVLAASKLSTFLANFNIIEYTSFQEALEEAIISLKQFVLDLNSEYYNYISIFQLVLVIYQMAVMIFIFLFGWLYFSSYLNIQLHQTKNYLQVIDINTLIENSYILTYIKKNSSL